MVTYDARNLKRYRNSQEPSAPVQEYHVQQLPSVSAFPVSFQNEKPTVEYGAPAQHQAASIHSQQHYAVPVHYQPQSYQVPSRHVEHSVVQTHHTQHVTPVQHVAPVHSVQHVASVQPIQHQFYIPPVRREHEHSHVFVSSVQSQPASVGPVQSHQVYGAPSRAEQHFLPVQHHVVQAQPTYVAPAPIPVHRYVAPALAPAPVNHVSVQAVQPVQPVQPVQTVHPVQPVYPVQPVHPVQPVQHQIPYVPEVRHQASVHVEVQPSHPIHEFVTVEKVSAPVNVEYGAPSATASGSDAITVEAPVSQISSQAVDSNGGYVY